MSTKLPKGLFDGYDTVIFCDTETSGLSPDKDYVVELSAITYTKSNVGMRKVSELEALIKLPDGVQMDPKAAAINGITDEKLAAEGFDRQEVLTKFAEKMQGKTLFVGYNACFDYAFMMSEFERMAETADKPDVRQICENTALAMKGMDVYDPLLTIRGRVVGADGHDVPHKLCNALEYYGVEGENSHRAMDDTKAMLNLIEALHKESPITEDDLNKFSYPTKYGPPPFSEKLKDCGKVFLDETQIAEAYEPIHVIDDKSKFYYPVEIWEKRRDIATEEDFWVHRGKYTYTADGVKKAMTGYFDEYDIIGRGNCKEYGNRLICYTEKLDIELHDDKCKDKEQGSILLSKSFCFPDEKTCPVNWAEIKAYKATLQPAKEEKDEIPEPVEDTSVETDETEKSDELE